MNLPSLEKLTREHLVLWVLHNFAKEFKNHAILKGGVQMALLSSARQTNDIDYIFVPFSSKNDIAPRIQAVLKRLEGAKITKSMNSRMCRFDVEIAKVAIQIEFSVQESERSSTLSTQLLAEKLGELPSLVRVLDPQVAFAHKIAAWNERRLIRDMYDIYFWYSMVKVFPDMLALKQRLTHIESRLPELKKMKRMSIAELVTELEYAIHSLQEKVFKQTLFGLVPQHFLDGGFMVFKTQLSQFATDLRTSENQTDTSRK